MLLSQLEYFVALAREEHFGRAAAACFVSQSALSESIRKLEAELDVPLVRRGRAFDGLTPEGDRLVVWARRILADHQALKDEMATLRSGLAGQLRLGIVPAATPTAALLIEPFCAEHPLARVRAETGLPSEAIIQRLRRFELDAGIIYPAFEDTSGLMITPLYEERHVVIAGERMLDPATTVLTGAQVAEMPLCLLPAEMRARQLLDTALATVGVELTPQIETDSLGALYAQVRTGRWASIVPHLTMHALPLPDGVRAVRLIEPDVRAPIALATAADEPVSVLAREFARTARSLRLDRELAA